MTALKTEAQPRGAHPQAAWSGAAARDLADMNASHGWSLDAAEQEHRGIASVWARIRSRSMPMAIL